MPPEHTKINMYAFTIVLLTGVLVAASCALLGVFLVLRKMAMLSDAISHAILPGIVAGYFFAGGPSLIFGFIGAAAASITTIALVEALQNTRKVGGESAIGIVFPAMFALGTAVVSKFYANVHIDTDAVLYGNIEFAAFDPLIINGANWGPQPLWTMGGLTLLNLLFVWLFFKELKLATFDPALAASLGFSPIIVHYALMAMVSVTTVGAFTAVGSVLVVAFMIVPAAAAYLLTDDLKRMIILAVALGALAAVLGFGAAVLLNASVAGSMATAAGVLFALVMLFSPSHGLLPKARRLAAQRERFALDALLVHLRNHEGLPAEEHESEIAHLGEELRWADAWAARIVARAVSTELVRTVQGHLTLTNAGRARADAEITAMRPAGAAPLLQP
jgi:manganese/zinc/iron transport system permease protein